MGPRLPPRCTAGRQPRRADRAVGDAIADELGQSQFVVPTDQSWGGDGFAWYTDRVPGVLRALGCYNGSPTLDLHASTFDVDERAIGLGVRAMVADPPLDSPAAGVSRNFSSAPEKVFSHCLGRQISGSVAFGPVGIASRSHRR